MKTLHAQLLGLFSLFIALCMTSRAGETVASATQPPAPPVVFTVMAWDMLDANRDLTLNYSVKGKPTQVTITWRDRSLPLTCDGPGPLVFTRTVTRDGKKIEEPLMTAVIPEGMTRALIVVGRSGSTSSSEAGLRATVIDDSYTKFPGQSVRFVNFSNKELGGSLGGRSFSITPKGDQVVAAPLSETNRLLPFRLARRDPAGGWKKLRSTGLSMTDGLRVLVFLLDDPRKPEGVEMVLIRDEVVPAPTKPASASGV